MEHIERAGIHSGDSIAVYPPQNLTQNQVETLVNYTQKLAKELNIIGLMNIQYVLSSEGEVFVIEVNPRSSRTVPFLSKITEIPMAQLATKVILGKKLKDLEVNSPYNLYKYRGLGPGPFNSPSEEAILAAIDPAQTDYEYFVADIQTKEVYFAKTYEEHLALKAKYVDKE